MGQQWRFAPLPESALPQAAAIEATASEPWSQQDLTETLSAPSGRLFGLWAADTLAGVAVFHLAADEAELCTITLSPGFRGQSGGLVLLAQSLLALEAEGCTRCTLEVRESNAPAIDLYRRTGFAAVGTRRHFYRNPAEDAEIYLWKKE